MPTEQYVNTVQTTLDGAINSSTTTIVVASTTNFPTTPQFRIVIDNELMLVTAMSGTGNTTWTVQRAVEGPYPAASHADDAVVTHILTAESLLNLVPQIQEEGTNVTPKRFALNFIGAGVTAADDAGNTRTNITVHDASATQTGAITTGTQTFAGNKTFSGNLTVSGNSSLGTVIAGTWQGTVIGPVYGGTGLSAYTLGDILYSSAANVLARLPGNTTTTRKFLSQTGTGSVSAAPEWSAIQSGDLPASVTNLLTLIVGTNIVINGSFEIWQRGGVFGVDAPGLAYTADRWFLDLAGSMTLWSSKETDAPAASTTVPYVINSMLIYLGTPQDPISSSDFAVLQQNIEGYMWKQCAQRVSTLSFWVNSSKTGTYCIALRNGGDDRSIVMEYTINAVSTWEYKTITFPASPSAGTWDYADSVGVKLSFVLAAGASLQTTAGSWQSGNFLATSNQINFADNIDNTFIIALVKLENGSAAAPFALRPFGQELSLCHRYCRSFETVSTENTRIGDGWAVDSTNAVINISLSPPMRAKPTLTVTASDWELYPGTGGATTITSMTLDSQSGTDLAVLKPQVSSGLTSQNNYFLRGDGGDQRRLILSAEL